MRLNDIHANYRDRVEFLCIYVREAHPDDGWRVPENLEAGIHVPEPTTNEERTDVARTCQLTLDLRMPMLVDHIDNRAEEAYKGMPMRLFLVAADGTIAYTGDQGPFGFDPDGWEQSIRSAVRG